MNLRFFIIFLAALFATPVFAQEPTKPPKGIQIRPLAVALSGELSTLHLRAGKLDLGQISLETTTLAQRYGVSVRQFAFGLNQPDGSFRSLGMVTLPEAGRDFILVFAPTKESYQVFPIRADDPEFRSDDSILFNFTPFKIRAMLGGSKKQIAPWQNAQIRPQFPKDATFYQATFAYERESEFIPFNNTRWPVNPNLKTLVFVYIHPETERPAYRGVSTLALESPE